MKPEERRLFVKFFAYLLVAVAVMAALVKPNYSTYHPAAFKISKRRE
jgi:hypothetical protein